MKQFNCLLARVPLDPMVCVPQTPLWCVYPLDPMVSVPQIPLWCVYPWTPWCVYHRPLCGMCTPGPHGVCTPDPFVACVPLDPMVSVFVVCVPQTPLWFMCIPWTPCALPCECQKGFYLSESGKLCIVVPHKCTQAYILCRHKCYYILDNYDIVDTRFAQT